MNMLVYAIIIFAIAALGGLVLASSVLRGKFAPWALSLLHAGLGAAGLVLMAMTIMNGEDRIMTAFGVLVVAALGGFYLAFKHLKQEIAPKGIVVIHAGAAVAGFALLVSMVYIHNLT